MFVIPFIWGLGIAYSFRRDTKGSFSPVPLPSGECETAAGAAKEHNNLVAPSVASWLASVICVLSLGTLQAVASSWLSAAPFRRSKG